MSGRNRHDSERGAVILETALALFIYALVLIFLLDAGVVLFRFSTLTETTAVLSRQMAIDLGRAWRNNAVSQAPSNGSCNAYIRTAGNAFLSKLSNEYSMDNPDAKLYFGATLDNSTALISDPSAPYAILNIVGTVRSGCVLCTIFPNVALRVESSQLVEFSSKNCNDYLF